MNPIEASQLLLHCSAFDNRRPNSAADQAWAAALHDVPLDADTLGAIARYYGAAEGEHGQRWIQPHHVRAHRQAIRNERLGPAGAGTWRELPVPQADPDDVSGYLAEIREGMARLASGEQAPLALTGGEPAGYDDNPHVQAILADLRAERERQALDRARQRQAEREGLAAYRDAVDVLLALPDHGERFLATARDGLLGDEQAARGFPVLAALPGVMDEHKITIHAAQLARAEAEEDGCAPTAD